MTFISHLERKKQIELKAILKKRIELRKKQIEIVEKNILKILKDDVKYCEDILKSNQSFENFKKHTNYVRKYLSAFFYRG